MEDTRATDTDIMTGFQLYHLIVYCPSEMDMKLYSFVDQLLSIESTRTIILSYANLFHSRVLKGTTSITLAKEFYLELATTLNLRYGNILLATSTKAQLQTVIENDGPLFTNYTDEVKACVMDNKCDRFRDIIGAPGQIYLFFFTTRCQI